MHPAKVTNALTIDVEDYFQVSAFAPHIPRSEWPTRECRVERNVDRILAMLDDHDTKATFFTLGWVAERYPELVRRIVAGGHELASHGYGHERATEQSEAAFFEDIRHAKAILEDLAGLEVKGYRAPSFSIGHQNLWAFDCLERAGYRYSSIAEVNRTGRIRCSPLATRDDALIMYGVEKVVTADTATAMG